jgi:hypothetical protein
MSPYLKITGRTFTIWLQASLINGLLFGIFFSVLHNNYSEIINIIIAIAFLSLFFSAPGFFLFWLFLLLKISAYTRGTALFRSALIAGFVLASVMAVFGGGLVSSEFNNNALIPAVCIILSAVSSIILHFKYLKKIE